MYLFAILYLLHNKHCSKETGTELRQDHRRLRETDGLAASVSDRMGRAGRSMQKFGAVGSVASFGVAVAFRDVIGLYDEQARAEAKVAQAVRQTAGAAGFAADQLYKQASALQEVTRFGDEAILDNVTAQLLTFKNISGETFLGAQEAALDLAAVLNGDLQGAAVMLGKALNDPAKGLSALAERGIQFSAAQSDVIKELARTGQVAEAQKLILDEIASAYGNQAEAARKAGAGILDAWSNTWGDIKENVGGVLVEVLPPIIDGLKSLTGWFEELTPQGQKTAVMLGAFAVAIPPVTAALGFMVTGMAALTGPVGLAIGGITALTAGLALLWPEQDKVTQSADLLTAAVGDEISQSQLLQQTLGGDISMSASAAKQKMSEAKARWENVSAIIAEHKALITGSAEYQNLARQLEDEGALQTRGPGPTGVIDPELYEIGAIGRRMSPQAESLLSEMADLVRIPAELSDQLERTEANITDLEAAIASAEDGVVTFGNGMHLPIATADRLKQTIAGGGGGGGARGGGGLTGAVKELAVETEEYANSEGWQTLKSNMRALIVDGQSWEETWKNMFGSVVDRLFDLAFSPAWDQLWANLERSMSGGGGFLGSLFGGLIGGGGGGGGGSPILGLDTGGDVMVSGWGGVDRNLTVLRTSDSERVSVRRPGDSMGGVTINMNVGTPDVHGFQKSRAQIARQLRGALARAER